jgi:hypothetical protein
MVCEEVEHYALYSREKVLSAIIKVLLMGVQRKGRDFDRLTSVSNTLSLAAVLLAYVL